MLRKISDHLPCFTTLNFNNKPVIQPKYIKIRDTGPQSMEDFRSEITKNIEKTAFNSDLMDDPNNNYRILENIIKSAHDKYFPLKEVRFNKYKHKIAPWITYGILNSMKFRDKLYVKWKKSDPATLNYQLQENSFKSYCSILQKNN